MEGLRLAEKREQPAGLVSPHRCLWELLGPEANQLRLALRLRTRAAGPGGNLIPFDRTPHPAMSKEGEG